ncbi:hypothetical protein ZWY2020_026777 [Hordeum vulgare]|nr:hypothetical protein ZWY2020_026777 [Hordeum vulgare]
MAPTGFCDLPTEALDDIARRAGPLVNVACPAVCRTWRRALKTKRLRVLERPKLPHARTTCTSTLAASARRGGRPCCPATPEGGSHGPTRSASARGSPTVPSASPWTWLACRLTLLEPLTGRQFRLPPVISSLGRIEQAIRNIGQGMFHKVALAPGRRLGTFAVMLVHSGG